MHRLAHRLVLDGVVEELSRACRERVEIGAGFRVDQGFSILSTSREQLAQTFGGRERVLPCQRIDGTAR
jgi:hypothetical protein